MPQIIVGATQPEKQDLLEANFADGLEYIATTIGGELSVHNLEFKGDKLTLFAIHPTKFWRLKDPAPIYIFCWSDPAMDSKFWPRDHWLFDKIFVAKGDYYLQIRGEALAYANLIINGSLTSDYAWCDNHIDEIRDYITLAKEQK
jgi:hypothetical protein